MRRVFVLVLSLGLGVSGCAGLKLPKTPSLDKVDLSSSARAAEDSASSVAASGDSPAWCRGKDPKTVSADIESELSRAGSYFSPVVAREIALSSCVRRTDAEVTRKHQDAAARHRAAFTAYNGFTNEDVDLVFAAAVDSSASDAAESAYCKALKYDAEVDARKDISAIQARQVLLCGKVTRLDPYDWFEARALEDAAFMQGCAALELGEKELKRGPHANALLHFAQCDVVASRLDAKRFSAELDAEKGLWADKRVWMKAYWKVYVERFGDIRKQYLAQARENAALKAAIVDAPAKAVASFTALRDKDRVLMDNAAELVKNLGNRKVALKHKGCSEDYRKALAKLFTTRRPSTEDAAKALLREPAGAMLGTSLVVCEGLEKRERYAGLFAESLNGTVTATGPMDAALFGALTAVLEHREDIDGGDHVETAFLKDLRLRDNVGTAEQQAGVIASVAKAGVGKVKVSFKKESWFEPVLECQETRRIDRIDASGKVLYRMNCKQVGQKKVESQVQPVVVEERFASALKSGRFARILTWHDDERSAAPVTVYTDKGQKTLVGYLGLGW